MKLQQWSEYGVQEVDIEADEFWESKELQAAARFADVLSSMSLPLIQSSLAPASGLTGTLYQVRFFGNCHPMFFPIRVKA